MTTEEMKIPPPMTDAECAVHMRQVEAEELISSVGEAVLVDPEFLKAFEAEMVLHLVAMSEENALRLIRPLVLILRQHEDRVREAELHGVEGTIIL